jgi:hypothetical protein
MAAERHELHELVDEVPEDQVAGAMAGVRRRLPHEAKKHEDERSGALSGPQIVRKKSSRDRRLPTPPNEREDAFPQVRPRFPVATNDEQRPPKLRVIVPLQRVRVSAVRDAAGSS